MGYIDTSVLAAYYCPEPLSASAQKEISAITRPAISRLVELELHSAVSQKLRMNEIGAPDANRILSLFKVHLAGGFYRLVPVDEGEYALARDWIGRFDTPLRTLDALHLAAAFANGLKILTADQGLARSAALLGVDHKVVS